MSFWYGARLGHWMWLLDEMLWLAVVDRLLVEHPGTGSWSWTPGRMPSLSLAARQVAARDGLVAREARHGSQPTQPRAVDAVRSRARPGRRQGRTQGGLARLCDGCGRRRPERRRRIVSLSGRRRSSATRSAACSSSRPTRASGSRRRPDHASSTPTSAPVVDRLRGTPLEPFEVDIRATMGDDDGLGSPDRARWRLRTLPYDVLKIVAPDRKGGQGRAEAAEVAARVGTLRTPLVVSGVDLGPALAGRISERDRRARMVAPDPGDGPDPGPAPARPPGGHPDRRRVPPPGLARGRPAEGVPVAAIQHGMIYRWHNGYMHRTRPPELRLPDRTYVFGRWERGC